MFKLIDTDASVTGTSLKGYIKADYSDLVQCFGEPVYQAERDGFSDKVWTEWRLEFEDAEGDYVKATIYDWKEDGPSASRDNPNYNWHIGGDSYSSEDAVKEMFEAFKMHNVDLAAEGLVNYG